MAAAPYTCLAFPGHAEAAAKFYVSIFPKSKLTGIQRMGPGKRAPVVSATFTLNGTPFVAINGDDWKFSEAMSQVVTCRTQKEIDYYWDALLADGGRESMCGWLVDRFGLSWQVIPENIGALISNPASAQAMFRMRKLDIATLKAASGAKPAAKQPTKRRTRKR